MRVSVICPVFNTTPDDLRAAIRSVLAQEGRGLHEVVIVDDGSTSEPTLSTLDEVCDYDPRIIRTGTGKTLGPAAARNLGIASATGDWIGFVDADDLWLPHKIAIAESVLAASPNCEWVIGDFATLYGTEQRNESPGLPCFSGSRARGPVSTPTLTRSILLDGLHLGTCLIRSDVIGSLRFNPKVKYGEDLQFLAELSLRASAERGAGLSYLCRRGQASMMYSSDRLSSKYASGMLAGRRNPAMRGFRREMRWALYRIFKDLAVNNILNGRRMVALWFAIKAFAVDPREIGEAAQFMRIIWTTNLDKVIQLARKYSSSEQIHLNTIQL